MPAFGVTMSKTSDVGLIDPRRIWNERFVQFRELLLQLAYEPWLDQWAAVLDTSRDLPILDLGCGGAFDSQYLTETGFCVIASDFSCEGLRVARDIAKQATMVAMDIREGMPFSEGAFQVIVANLSLHYHRWQQTQVVMGEVRKRLRAGGYLLARVNSTKDNEYGATCGEVVEHHCRVVNGLVKRYFDQEDLRRLFGDGWLVEELAEQVVHCYPRPKVLWEIAARKV
jgi:SAM-dependent methyltransferase